MHLKGGYLVEEIWFACQYLSVFGHTVIKYVKQMQFTCNLSHRNNTVTDNTAYM